MDTPNESWHLDKKVPIALLGAILCQTFVFGWWAASLQDRVAILESREASFETANARLDAAREALTLRLTRIEDKQDTMLGLLKHP